MTELSPWETLESRVTYRDEYISVRTDRCRRSDGHIIPKYHMLEYPGWVTVVALTPEREIVMIREYRHGSERVMTGLPSGALEPGEDDYAAGAARELLEETGYVCETLHEVGRAFANPAVQNNENAFYLGFGARKVAEPDFDANELIETVLVPWDGFDYGAGPDQHAIYAAAFYYAARQHDALAARHVSSSRS